MSAAEPLRSTRAARLAILAVSIAAAVACRTPGALSVPASPPAPVPTLYDTQRAITEYIDSGRYDADFADVVAGAQAWLEKRAPQVKRPAIVLDIDETSLSNWPAYRVNGWARLVAGGCDLERGPCSIRAWQAMGRSKALAPTLALVRRARELGVAVFFISGRPPEQRPATEGNLRTQGYVWTRLILLPRGAHFASAVDFKAPARRMIAELGYTILLSMGDQQSDLDGGYAEKTFKLPNPVYFLP